MKKSIETGIESYVWTSGSEKTAIRTHEEPSEDAIQILVGHGTEPLSISLADADEWFAKFDAAFHSVLNFERAK